MFDLCNNVSSLYVCSEMCPWRPWEGYLGPVSAEIPRPDLELKLLDSKISNSEIIHFIISITVIVSDKEAEGRYTDWRCKSRRTSPRREFVLADVSTRGCEEQTNYF